MEEKLMKFRKLLAVLLVLVAVFTLTACTKETNNGNNGTEGGADQAADLLQVNFSHIPFNCYICISKVNFGVFESITH